MDDPDERQPLRASAARIDVQCLSCGRRGSLDGDDDRVADAPLVHLTRRLRCSACGSRAVKATTVRTPADLARLMRERMGGGS
ncbi:hypothetical protein [uncultured Enterovirga sp.]|uniref:hypothetical protein n=1 Tax=uncultured Enterovirga sp. TaxID=2026352 RepID=UPI0035C9A1CE